MFGGGIESTSVDVGNRQVQMKAAGDIGVHLRLRVEQVRLCKPRRPNPHRPLESVPLHPLERRQGRLLRSIECRVIEVLALCRGDVDLHRFAAEKQARLELIDHGTQLREDGLPAHKPLAVLGVEAFAQLRLAPVIELARGVGNPRCRLVQRRNGFVAVLHLDLAAELETVEQGPVRADNLHAHRKAVGNLCPKRDLIAPTADRTTLNRGRTLFARSQGHLHPQIRFRVYPRHFALERPVRHALQPFRIRLEHRDVPAPPAHILLGKELGRAMHNELHIANELLRNRGPLEVLEFGIRKTGPLGKKA